MTTLTWDTAFTIEFLDPPLELPGFFDIRANELVDFSFTVFGRTWTEADVQVCDCRVSDQLDFVGFRWIGGDDSWFMAMAFAPPASESVFGLTFGVDGMFLNGSSRDNAGIDLSFDYTIGVPAPGTFALLLGGLVLLAVIRRLRSL